MCSQLQFVSSQYKSFDHPIESAGKPGFFTKETGSKALFIAFCGNYKDIVEFFEHLVELWTWKFLAKVYQLSIGQLLVQSQQKIC